MSKRISTLHFVVSIVVVLSFLFDSSLAAEHGFKFAGTVLFVGDAPYEVPVTPFSDVFGSFVYESNSRDAFPIAGCDCAGYRHEQINGFWANFVGTKIQADEYIVEVRNNIEIFEVGTADMISWLYPGHAGPDLETPLLVDGTSYEAGMLRIDLVADSSLFSDSSLPEDIDSDDFMLILGLSNFGDEMPEGEIDVLFDTQLLEETPLLESDHDLDGDVDGRDFLIWQRHFATDTSNGDANSDLFVDGEDLAAWRTQFGAHMPAMSVAYAVPEPSAITLLFVTWLACLSRSRSTVRA